MRRALLLAAVVLVAGCAEHLPDQDLRIRNTRPAFKMPPDELWMDFNRDPKAARSQYFGKAVDIAGKVVAVQPGADKVPVVFFSNPAEHGLRARLLDESAAAVVKNATPGSRITLRCFIEGLTPEQNLLLKSCIQP